jgi:glutamyl/glutaminyl-tRNA synthetase
MFRAPEYNSDLLKGVDPVEAEQCTRSLGENLKEFVDPVLALKETCRRTNLNQSVVMKVARTAITGATMGAPIAETISILGLAECTSRLDRFLMCLNEEKLKRHM